MEVDKNCIFCRIVSKEIQSTLEYEDESCMVFHDINPRSKIHMLIIPKKHIPTLRDIQAEDESTLGRMMWVAAYIAKKMELEHYKLLMSVGEKAGQEVFHIHLHVMSAPS